MTYQPHQSEDVTMKPVAGMNIDEAALKADPSDSEIMEIAGRWFHTGENQHRADGYYYRSLGTPTNVRGSDLIAFARALLHRSQPVAFRARVKFGDGSFGRWHYFDHHPALLIEKPDEEIELLFNHPKDTVVPAEQAEDSAMLDWLETHPSSVSHGIGGWRTSDLRTHFNLRAALRAAIGRNREAGGS